MKKSIMVWILFALIFGMNSLIMAEEVDFKRKKVTWIIPFKVGGGTDVWARIYAPFIKKHLPGQPTVAIKNIPGGGSITGSNYFHKRARKSDGLTVLGVSASTTLPYLLDNKKVRYDLSHYHIVFASPVGGIIYINPETGINKVTDLKGFKGELAYASQGATSMGLIPMLAFDLLGMDVKAIFGYKGRGSGRVAFEQGEVNIDFQTTAAYLKNVKPLIKAGKAVPLWSLGMLDENNKIIRDPVAPELPSFPEAYEMIHGEKPSGSAWKAWKSLFVAAFSVQKSMWLPKKTKPEIVDAYRQAAENLSRDKEFQTVVDKSLGGYNQFFGIKAQNAFNQVLNVSDEDKKWLHQWLKDKWGVKVN